jgi:hypothetical protein
MPLPVASSIAFCAQLAAPRQQQPDDEEQRRIDLRVVIAEIVLPDFVQSAGGREADPSYCS